MQLPTVVSGTVFAGSRDGTLYAVNAATGTERWDFETDNKISRSPTAVDEMLFMRPVVGTLYVVATEAESYDTRVFNK